MTRFFALFAVLVLFLGLVPVADAQGCNGNFGSGCNGGFASAGGCSGSQGGPARARLFSGGLLHRSSSGGGLFARRSSRNTTTATTIQVDRAAEIQLAPPAPKAMP